MTNATIATGSLKMDKAEATGTLIANPYAFEARITLTDAIALLVNELNEGVIAVPTEEVGYVNLTDSDGKKLGFWHMVHEHKWTRIRGKYHKCETCERYGFDRKNKWGTEYVQPFQTNAAPNELFAMLRAEERKTEGLK